MLKVIFYAIVIMAVVIAIVAIYHLQKVKVKNKAEMAEFTKEVPLQANLGKTLVVYYSLSGHTKDIALQIADKTKADVYEIETIEIYSSPSVYMKSKKELSSKNYPELKQGSLPDIANYDTIFIGGPVWWYTMAPAVYSFLQKVDFTGKRVVPFSTQGSNAGTFFEDFAKMVENAQILAGEKFNNMDDEYKKQVSNKINAWLNSLSL